MGNHEGQNFLKRFVDARYAKVREIAERGPVTGEGLRAMREAMGLTGRELATILDAKSSETISRWEHNAPRPDRWAFALVGSMMLDHIEGRATTRGRLAVLRAGSSAEDNVRRAIVEAVRPFVDDRWRHAMDRKERRQWLREIAPTAEHQRANRRRYAALSEEERTAEDELFAHADAQSVGRAQEYKKEINAAEAARFQELTKLLEGIDPRFASVPKSIARALQTAGAPVAAARLGWDAGVEGRRPGEKWRDVRAKVEARYRKAAT